MHAPLSFRPVPTRRESRSSWFTILPVDEAAPELRTRDKTAVVTSEHAISTPCHDVVRAVADRVWHQADQLRCPPRPAQGTGDKKRSIAPGEHARCCCLVIGDDVERRR